MPTTGQEIIAMKRNCEQMKPYQRSDCPIDGWPLEKHPETQELHCSYCGWPWRKSGPWGDR